MFHILTNVPRTFSQEVSYLNKLVKDIYLMHKFANESGTGNGADIQLVECGSFLLISK
jgi:hypothetical protein